MRSSFGWRLRIKNVYYKLNGDFNSERRLKNLKWLHTFNRSSDTSEIHAYLKLQLKVVRPLRMKCPYLYGEESLEFSPSRFQGTDADHQLGPSSLF